MHTASLHVAGLAAAAVQGRALLGERAGQADARVGRHGRHEPSVKGPLCAEVEGFSLHAGAWVAARDREGLARGCGKMARMGSGWSGTAA